MYLKYTDMEILDKSLADQIQEHIKVIHHNQIDFVPKI